MDTGDGLPLCGVCGREYGTELVICDAASLSADWFQEIRSHLPRRRLEKADRIRSERGKQVSLLSGWLLHSALSSRGYSEEDLEEGPDGKPLLREGAGEFWFSLSHKGSVAVFFASGSGPVGADVEEVKPVRGTIPSRFYTEAEQAVLRSLTTEEEYLEAFYRIWTGKEAYGKLLGGGLKDGLPFSAEALAACRTGRENPLPVRIPSGEIMTPAVEIPAEGGPVLFRVQPLIIRDRLYIVTICGRWQREPGSVSE